MDANLLITLQNYGLSEKEARVYLTVLELGTSIASTIARRAELNRVTTYTILEDLQKDGIVNETGKEGVKYYSVISPDVLLKQLEQKYESFKEKVPELLALAEKLGNKPKVYFFEGIEGLKKMYTRVVLAGEQMKEPFLTFVGTSNMDPVFRKRLDTDFMKIRKTITTKTKAILSKKDAGDSYIAYHKASYTSIMIDNPVFAISNEIVLFGENSVGLMMYETHELCGLVIESKTLYQALKSMFNLIREIYKTHPKIKKNENKK